MKKVMTMMLLAGVLGAWGQPRPADAAVIECIDESIGSCNDDFGGGSEQMVAIRGWCYMIRWTLCAWGY